MSKGILRTVALVSAVAAVPVLGYGQNTGASPAPSAPSSAKPNNPRSAIYGRQLMTPEERAAYRDRMRSAKTAAERNEIRAQHHKDMQARAKERGVTLPDQPPRRHGRGPRNGRGPNAGG
jgi:hypothetical protein